MCQYQLLQSEIRKLMVFQHNFRNIWTCVLYFISNWIGLIISAKRGNFRRYVSLYKGDFQIFPMKFLQIIVNFVIVYKFLEFLSNFMAHNVCYDHFDLKRSCRH